MSLFAKYYGTGKTKHRKAKYQAVHVMTCILRVFAKHSTVVYSTPRLLELFLWLFPWQEWEVRGIMVLSLRPKEG